MADVTQLLTAAEAGDPRAAAQLLPLVYDELRQLAAARLAAEQPGQTLQPTALVHEAYLRLAGGGPAHGWNGRGHFFAAAAEAMRRILVEAARRKKTEKHGGGRRRVELGDHLPAPGPAPDQLLAVDDALGRLGAEDPTAAELVKLRYYAGLSVEEAGDALGLSRATAYRLWAYARSWLRCAVSGGPPDDGA
ncbi:MAG TPA: ECF-type sigma factor [Gemmataceae bacterium]|jgi:RNA polymerase sigma factor (TIGR02999 family)